MSCTKCVIISTSMSLGVKNPMGPGPHRKRQLIHGLLPEPLRSIQLQDQGIVCHLPSFAEQECTLQAMRASTNIQPRRNLPPLVPEFKQISHHLMLVYSALPKGGLSRVPKKKKDNQVTVGVHFSPEEFLNEAVRLCHPTEHNSLFPKEVRANKAHLSSKTIHQVAQERTEEVKRWVALSKELVTKERDLKSSISPRIAEIFKDKKLCRRDFSMRPVMKTWV